MDGSIAPVSIEDGEKATKKVSTAGKTSKGGWNSAIFIVFVEVAERFAFFGLGNLIQYLTNELHQSTATAAKNITTWIGVSALFPIAGAIIADSYLGRFKTVILSTIIHLMGMILLTLSVSVVPVHHREAVFFTALYILAVGEGGHKPSVQTFAADQFDEENPGQKAAKSSFFNWWYSSIVVAATVAVLVIIYIQEQIGWTLGYGILAGTIALALIIFLIGSKRYRKEAPLGSPLTGVAQVFVAAAKKRHLSNKDSRCGICYGHERGGTNVESQPTDGSLAHTNEFRFLDKAMIVDNLDASSETRNPWRLCTLNQVEEVKLVLRLIPIWLACLMFTPPLVQSHTFYIKQGATMVRSIGPHFKFPAGSLQALSGFAILLTIVIYDRVFVPAARKLTGHHSGITILQRIGFGLFLSILEMIVAALVEAKRVNTARDHGLMDSPKAVVPMAVWWLIPQYAIAGTADVFTIVGLQELFYDQMPESMRSVGAAFYLSVTGIGSFINTAVITVVQAVTSKTSGGEWLGDNLNRAHIDYYYWVLAVLSALNLCIYVWAANGFVYKKVKGEEEDATKEQELSHFGA